MLSPEKRAAIKSGLLVLVGGLSVLLATEIKSKKELSGLSCQLRLMLIANEVKPQFVVPLKDAEEEAIVGMISLQEKVVIRLTKTDGNFLLEEQCVRADGHKVLMEIKRESISK